MRGLLTRRLGRGARGLRRLAAVPHRHGTTTTRLAGVRASGLTAPDLVEGALNGPRCRASVEPILAPPLTPGDLVLLDHRSRHKVAGRRQAVDAPGARLLALPPDSPERNPIAPAVAKLKAMLRTAAERTRDGLWKARGRLVDRDRPDECRNLFNNAGDAT